MAAFIYTGLEPGEGVNDTPETAGLAGGVGAFTDTNGQLDFLIDVATFTGSVQSYDEYGDPGTDIADFVLMPVGSATRGLELGVALDLGGPIDTLFSNGIGGTFYLDFTISGTVNQSHSLQADWGAAASLDSRIGALTPYTTMQNAVVDAYLALIRNVDWTVVDEVEYNSLIDLRNEIEELQSATATGAFDFPETGEFDIRPVVFRDRVLARLLDMESFLQNVLAGQPELAALKESIAAYIKVFRGIVEEFFSIRYFIDGIELGPGDFDGLSFHPTQMEWSETFDIPVGDVLSLEFTGGESLWVDLSSAFPTILSSSADYGFGARVTGYVWPSVVSLGPDNDRFDGTAGNDIVEGLGGNDTLSGLAGDDSLDGGDGDDSLSGDADADTLLGGFGNDTLRGGDGDDSLRGQGGDDSLFGGRGHDLLIGDAGHDVIQGSSGDDTALGQYGNDTIFGGAGHDELRGYFGDDSLSGGDGNDWLVGANGDDRLFGGNGSDTVSGGLGNDLAHLGAGHDSFEDGTHTSETDNDTIAGQGGRDTIDAGSGDDLVYGNKGNDRILGGDGNDRLFGGENNDTLLAGAGADTVTGGDGSDRAYLGSGDDVWQDNGQATFGNDVVLAGNGNDTIGMGGGNDTATGGAGADTFVFSGRIDSDTLTDYLPGTDRLQIDRALWGDAPLDQARLDVLSVTDAVGLLLDFGAGNTIFFRGLASNAGLIDDIMLI
ncbi:calcium-binding protein [Thetidibacter halocola]|uniref:Calcium-binding protein n=1 Tax=Thetidibacter halocola TaxID=2827239 RepID=A0A8J8BBL0_9RHOB|nr:calcium-binding protein [Thetidibacter halocola]MBS0126333.1 hypothetical protein [Thetidibacter halocola]